MKKQKDESTQNNRVIISAPIVKKKKVDLLGITHEVDEFYVRRSIQDYFIKFCESDVNRAKFNQRFEANSSLINTMKLEVTFKTGYWDNCIEKVDDKSRQGEYVIIHQIF